MKSSNTNAQNVVLGSTDFPWKWNLSDLDKRPKNGLKVFSCFSCGGGSSMGYKLAGYDVIGNVEIDPKMMSLYKANNHPKYSYLMDIRDFVKLEDEKIPKELKELDILDGSPPCSVFSMAGTRERGWNVEKVFREGQARQRLDDLFFYFIDVAKKLKPKVVIAENVRGLVTAGARGWVNKILKAFDEAGYVVQIFLLNAATMGVPQKRERVFFIAHRKDLDYPKIRLSFKVPQINFGKVRDSYGKSLEGTLAGRLAKYRLPKDRDLSDVNKRVRKSSSCFTSPIVHDNEPAQTITAKGYHLRMCDGLHMTDKDIVSCQTFPQDYNFLKQSVQYVCGMSVPPVMMAKIAEQVYLQWLRD